MKKGFLIFIIICILLLIAGITILVIGLRNGGSLTFNVDYKKGIISSSDSKNLTEGSQKFDEFDSIDINVDAASISFENGTEYKVEYSLPEDDVSSIKVENGTLKISSKMDGFNFSFNSNGITEKNDPYIKITMPEGTSLSVVSLNVDYGEITLGGFDMEKLTIDSDAGNMNITDSSIGELKIECDAGNVEVSDSKADTIDIKNDYGNIDLALNAEEADYDIDVEIDFGTLSLNGKKLKSDYTVKNGKDKKISISTDAGDVSIDFK